MANDRPTTVITGEVRISYEHLLEPYSNSPSKPPRYSATLLIPKHDVATKQRLEAAIEAAKQEGVAKKWGGTAPPVVPIPIHDGDGVRQSDGNPFGEECKGHWVMTASSKQKQDVVDANVQTIMDATQVYSGMYANVMVNFFAYFQEGKKGIGCGLGPVKKTRDGEPLGGRMTAEDAFGAAQQPAAPAATGYGQPMPQQPAVPQQGYPSAYGGQAPAQPQQPVHPVTGQPMAPGGVMGVNGQQSA